MESWSWCGERISRGRRRAQIAVGLAIAVGVAEVVFGVVAYGRVLDVDLALGLACGGVVAFAVIDVWIRPRTVGALQPCMPVWALVPFLCALGSSAWIHYREWRVALHDIKGIARALDAPQPRAAGGPPVALAMEDQIAAFLASRSLQTLAGPKEKEHVIALVRVIARDLERAHGDPDRVAHKAARDTLMNFCLTLGEQALFVLWIPFLLMISLARARRALEARRGGASELEPAPTTRCVRDALDLRDESILAEDRAYFVPRLCFGILLVLGTTYVFAPFGLKTSYMLALVNEHALPGQTSFALWCSNFSEVPIIVVGFVGFLIYALITATQRFAQNDLDDLAVFSLLVRGLVVVLLSIALSSSPMNEEAARMFVFMAGVFPIRALEALAKRANVTLDPDFATDGPGSFAGVTSLDPQKVFALRAAGIHSTNDLAAMPIEVIAQRVRIDPRLLGRAVDRAVLIDAIGCPLADRLEPFAITSATELVAALPIPASISGSLGDAPERAATRLAADPRIAQIRRWLASAQE